MVTATVNMADAIRCPREGCGWIGTVASANLRLNELVSCPKCFEVCVKDEPEAPAPELELKPIEGE